jgi:Holliday junction DNA helicase RuvB
MANAVRPSRFDDIIGQSDVLERLKIVVAGCKSMGGVMPHVLIDGPPGLGKTTIASAIATEMGENLYVVNGANVRSIKNLLPYLMGIAPRSVLFIDEIHRLPKIVEEFLYPVMEDFCLSIVVENKPESIELPQFTLVGATTCGGRLSQPFYDRFQIKEHLSFYSHEDLAKLARSNSEKLGLKLGDDELVGIARRSKGTPRILNSRLQWYKSYTAYHKDRVPDIEEVFLNQGIDGMGLDVYDRLYMDLLKKNRMNPLGLKSISSLTGIAIETIENSIEPFLIRMGYVVRTQKGRVIGDYK